MNNLNVRAVIIPRSPHLLMWTRQDVFKTPRTSLSVSASHIFFSSQPSCYASVQLRHFLIHNSCSLLVHPHPKTSFLHSFFFLFPFFFFLLPQTVILSPTTKKYVFIIPFHTLLMVCASWYVWSSVSLPGQAVIYLAGDILYAACNILLHLVILSMYGRQEEAMACLMFRIMSTYYK